MRESPIRARKRNSKARDLGEALAHGHPPALFRHRLVVLPQPFESFGQGLLFHAAVRVPGVAGKDKLVTVSYTHLDVYKRQA